MISKISLALVLLATCFISISAMADAPSFQFEQQPGPYPVGLKVAEQYDYSRVYRPSTDSLGRPYQGERARPVQTLIWYPAESSAVKPMTVGDYVDLAITEIDFDAHEANGEKSPRYAGWAARLAPFRSVPLWARRDAALARGRFPVVVYAPSDSAVSWENADLCEYLASHGYVVIASPSMGAQTCDMTDDVRGIGEQARDISFLIGYAQSLPDTDMSEIAVAGWSWGGLSNLFAAARDERIDALVALDGSMRYFPGLVKQAGDVHPEQMRIPLLFFTQGEITLEQSAELFSGSDNASPNVLNAWTHGDLFTIDMLGMAHPEFSSMVQRKHDQEQFAEDQKADYGREDANAGYAWVARYTLKFLDAYLKHDTAAAGYLKNTPAMNGVPRHFMTSHFRAADGTPASLESFRAKLGKEGFGHAADIYAAMQKDPHPFKPGESDINAWAYELMNNHHLAQALELFKLNVQIYPASSNAYESLGEAYAQSGQKELAITCYEKSLELDPSDEAARQQLKKMRGGVGVTR